MPKITLPAPVSRDQLRAALTRTCPDLEQNRMGPGVSASTSRWVAAWVMPQKKQIHINPGIRSVPMMLLFLLMALTGIGIVIWAIAVVPKQQALIKRIHAALERDLLATAAARAT